MLDRTSRAALGFFALTTMLFWLMTVRGAFDGPSYQWGLAGFGGNGVGGDYWLPLLGAAFALVVLAAGWRSRGWAFGVVAIWSLLLAAAVVALVTPNPDDFRFRGDTFGVDVSLAWIGPLLFGAGAVVALVAARRQMGRAAAMPPWSRQNSRWAILLASALPLQFLLLRLGGPESLADRIGVVVTIVQWFLLGRVFQPTAGTRA
jgi:hypothetical protein